MVDGLIYGRLKIFKKDRRAELPFYRGIWSVGGCQLFLPVVWSAPKYHFALFRKPCVVVLSDSLVPVEMLGDSSLNFRINLANTSYPKALTEEGSLSFNESTVSIFTNL